MRAAFFDTGPLISLSLNNLLWTLPELKVAYGGRFFLPKSVYKEAVDIPLCSKKFKFEAIQIAKLVSDGVFEIYEEKGLEDDTKQLLEISNQVFSAQGNYIKNVHFTEMEAICGTIKADADCVVIDEFVTRMLVENPLRVKDRMESRLHTPVTVNKENLRLLKEKMKGLHVLRSIELMTYAFESGILNSYVLSEIEDPRRLLLEAILWGLKLNGCSVTEKEIDEMMLFEGFKLQIQGAAATIPSGQKK